MIDIRIVTFLTVAAVKNFSKTAEILHITQPAVSQHIKYLEENYNVKLFDKKKKPIALTEEGRLLHKYALDMYRLNRTAENEIRNSSAIVKKYHIGATMTIGGYVLPRIIGMHKRTFPNIDIMLYVDNTEGIIKRLIRGEIMMGVIEGPFDRRKFDFAKFKDDELILAVSPEHQFAMEKSVSIERILSDKLILREKGSGTRKIFENELVKNGFILKDEMIYMEIGNINALVSLVESNLGCTIISREAVKESLKAGTLIEIEISDLKIFREFNFIYFDDHDEFVEDYIKFCISHIA
jgi:DNA-binding transcriptional LysR family regulator